MENIPHQTANNSDVQEYTFLQEKCGSIEKTQSLIENTLVLSFYALHEMRKTRIRRKGAEVEHGSFPPFAFTSTGSTGPKATTFYNTSARLLTDMTNEQ